MKIAFICNEYPESRRGGQGVVVHDLARALVAAGHEARVIGIYDRAPFPEDGYDADGIFHRSLRKANYPLAWIPARRRLFCELRNWSQAGEVDLIEAPLSRGLIAGCPPLPIPVILRLHGSSVCRAKAIASTPPRWHRGLERRALARADGLVSVSQFMADQVAAEFAHSGPVTVIPNPVDLPRGDWSGSNSQSIVFAGNRDELKGLPELLTSWPQVRAQFPDATLHLFGRRQGNHDQAGVVSHGHRPRAELLNALSAARAAIFPSRFEAFGLVALEAMASGCPTIVGKHGAGAEIGRPDHDLIVTDCTAEAIANSLCRLLATPTLSKELSKNGRQTAEQFALPEIFPRNEQYWEQIVAEFRKPARAF